MKEPLRIKKYPLARYNGNLPQNAGPEKQYDTITTCGAISTLMKPAKR